MNKPPGALLTPHKRAELLNPRNFIGGATGAPSYRSVTDRCASRLPGAWRLRPRMLVIAVGVLPPSPQQRADAQWPCLRTVSGVVAPYVSASRGLTCTLTQGHWADAARCSQSWACCCPCAPCRPTGVLAMTATLEQAWAGRSIRRVNPG